MPLFADAATLETLKTVGAGAGGSVLALAVGAAFAWGYFRKQLAEIRTASALADEAEARAAEMPIGQWRTIVARQDERIAWLTAQIEKIGHDHADCERRTAVHEVEMRAVKAQNAGQQAQLDTNRATIADLTAKVSRLVEQLRGFGVTDTGEHTSLPPG